MVAGSGGVVNRTRTSSISGMVSSVLSWTSAGVRAGGQKSTAKNTAAAEADVSSGPPALPGFWQLALLKRRCWCQAGSPEPTALGCSSPQHAAPPRLVGRSGLCRISARFQVTSSSSLELLKSQGPARPFEKVSLFFFYFGDVVSGDPWKVGLSYQTLLHDSHQLSS